MKTLQRMLMIFATLVLATWLTACGAPGSQSPTSSNGATNQTTTGKTAYKGAPTATPTAPAAATPTPVVPTPTPTMATNNNTNMGNAFIGTTTVTINGNMVNVLTNNKGFLLYYYMDDMMGTSNCTAMCAQNWPPLLAPQGMMTINSSMMLPKQLSIHMTTNGNQVFYDGHALYTYVGDKQPGQFTGRGVGNVWYLVGFDL